MNLYTFHCPVKNEATTIDHCQGVHSDAMQGKHENTEDKTCALAHLCYMCPFRNAVQVGGIWSKSENMPRADKPQEKPAKLAPEFVKYALRHTTPTSMDYRRVGLRLSDEKVAAYREMFRDLSQSKIEGLAPSMVYRHGSDETETKTPRPMAGSKIKMTDGIDSHNENDMADAITAAVKKEREKAPEKSKSVSKQSAGKKHSQRAEKPAQSVSDASKKPMSLAERAKLMKAGKKS